MSAIANKLTDTKEDDMCKKIEEITNISANLYKRTPYEIVANRLIDNLFKYEKHFKETGKKSNFDIAKNFIQLLTYFDWSYRGPNPVVHVSSTYTITLAELLDRLTLVNKVFSIEKFIFYMDFSFECLYGIRNTTLFLNILECLSNIDVVKSIIDRWQSHMMRSSGNRNRYVGNYNTSKYYISNYINIYLFEIISNANDNNFINKEIILLEKIINNLYNLNCKDEIIHTCKHLLFYSHKFNISKKEKSMHLCNILLKYIIYDLNILETIEYNSELKFTKTDEIDLYHHNIEIYIHKFNFRKMPYTNISFFDKVNLETMRTYYINTLEEYKYLISNVESKK